MGCAVQLCPPAPTVANGLLWNFGLPLEGYEASGNNFLPGVGAVAMDTVVIPSAAVGSDVLVLRTTRQGQPTFRTTAAVTNVASDLQVTRNANTTVPADTPMIIADCSGAATFMATSFTGVTTTTATVRACSG